MASENSECLKLINTITLFLNTSISLLNDHYHLNLLITLKQDTVDVCAVLIVFTTKLMVILLR